MASATSISLEFAKEFAARLAPAFDSPFAIAAVIDDGATSRLDILQLSHPDDGPAQSLQSHLLQSDWPSDFFTTGIATIPMDSTRSILVIDASENRDRSIAILSFAPDASHPLIETLIAAVRAHLELTARNPRNECPLPIAENEDYSESFIEQITQDFEELTWLRQSHRFADLYSVKASPVELAHACVASLAEVIQAESLIFLEISGLNVQATVDPSKLHLLAGPPVDLTAWTIHQWIEELSEKGRKSPILLDRSRDERHLERFPWMQNIMMAHVAKGERTYGWLIAINKIPPHGETCGDEGFANNLHRPRFGTFEAGLLTTAANMLASQASNSELFAAQEELTKGLVLAIINAIDAKDGYTAGHSERVASFAYVIASRMGLASQQCDRIHMAGLLHDVGKIGIPDSILKKPAKLTEEEFRLIKTHPVIGYSILKHLNSIDYVLPGVLHHHEAFDGSGYPQGLRGDAIPLMARILAVSDAFDAMTSTRAYRNALSLEEATQIFENDCCATWDSEIVHVLFECVCEGVITPGQVTTSNKMNRNSIAEWMNDTDPMTEHDASLSGS
jgi:HD-GYP domain-containing protein (c-di-GMP phosphodiesterase class II)